MDSLEGAAFLALRGCGWAALVSMGHRHLHGDCLTRPRSLLVSPGDIIDLHHADGPLSLPLRNEGRSLYKLIEPTDELGL